MDSGLWTKILLGMLAVVAIFMFGPGIKGAMRKSREAEHKDWPAVLIPLAVVGLFVVLLISLV